MPFEGDYFSDYAPSEFKAAHLATCHEGVDPSIGDKAGSAGGEVSSGEEGDDEDKGGEDPGLEPPMNAVPCSLSPEEAMAIDEPSKPEGISDPTVHRAAKETLCSKTIVVRFLGGLAGEVHKTPPVNAKVGWSNYAQKAETTKENPYTPFCSKIDWDLTRWAKCQGPGSTAVTDLLQIKNVSVAVTE